MNEHLQQLAYWGYRVEATQQVDGVEVFYVQGFGLATYVRDDDTDVLAALADQEDHEERVAQAGETREETLMRWVREGRIAPPYED
jgi:hypothetical protein